MKAPILVHEKIASIFKKKFFVSRYSMLLDLLEKSKFFVDYLKKKMEVAILND